MKRMQKVFALLAVLGLLFTLWAPVASASATPTAAYTAPRSTELLYFGRSILAQMNNSDALCYAYDRLVEECGSIADYVDISHSTYKITNNEASLVYYAVMNDHPEFFWLSDGMSLSVQSKTVIAFVPYVYDGTAAEQDALQQRVATLTAGLSDKSDYEKSLILHDRLCDAITYHTSSYDQNVIGSLVQGVSVCAGYARGYQLLLQTVGIPCYYVTGNSKGQAHAWNLVQLDGEWYYTDVTWDDQNDEGGNIYYAYLNLTYDRMAEDHTADMFAEYLPRSTATAANYHIQNGTAMDLPNADAIVAMYEAGQMVRMYMTGDKSAFANALPTCIAEAMEHIACPGSGYGYSSLRLSREIILSLSPDQPHNYSGNACTHCGYVREGGNTPDVPSVPDIPVDPTLGDVNGDGKRNNRDLGLLQQYLNDWDVSINTAACDLNSDGRINNRDLGLLLQQLNA